MPIYHESFFYVVDLSVRAFFQPKTAATAVVPAERYYSYSWCCCK